MNAPAVQSAPARKSVLVDMAFKFGMEPEPFEATVRATCMPTTRDGKVQASREEFAAFLLVAKEHDLNPLTREIYAFPRKGGGIVPIVSIDGWVKLINRQELDGIEFDETHAADGKLISTTCRIHRKDRRLPVSVTEYMAECYRETDQWRNMPHRMLRHKSLIQCGRYAFGFAGIYDEDEAERIVAAQEVEVGPPRPSMRTIDAKPTKVDASGPAVPQSPDAAEDAGVIAAPTEAPASASSDDMVYTPVRDGPVRTTTGKAVFLDGTKDGKRTALKPEDLSENDRQIVDSTARWFELREEITAHLVTAQTMEHLEEVRELFREEIEKLPRSDREALDYLFEIHDNRIVEAGRKRVEEAGGKGIREYMDEDRKDEKQAAVVMRHENINADSGGDAKTQPVGFGGGGGGTTKPLYYGKDGKLTDKPPAESLELDPPSEKHDPFELRHKFMGENDWAEYVRGAIEAAKGHPERAVQLKAVWASAREYKSKVSQSLLDSVYREAKATMEELTKK